MNEIEFQILEYLSHNNNVVDHASFEIQESHFHKHIIPIFGSTPSQYINTLKELEKLEYVDSIANIPVPHLAGYTISTLGRTIIQNEQARRDAIIQEDSNRKSWEQFQKDMQNKMFAVTAFLAVSTGIAAIFYAIEICKHFHWCCP